MVSLKQTLQDVQYRELYIPLQTRDVPQFAFAAFSRVAAGHKVNSSLGGGGGGGGGEETNMAMKD